MPKAVPANPKKIILCCDGTSQSSVSGELSLPSNITRIARTIAKAGDDGKEVWQQLVYYDAGVGTGALSWIESVRQGATGDGLITNVLEAYNFVVNNYSPGDKIYCFGFSRGAFTARAIAGMITDFGVIKPDSMKDFPSLFAAYKKNTNKYNFRKTKEYFEWYAGKDPLEHESQKDTVRKHEAVGDIAYENSQLVELVGVFDTVGSLALQTQSFISMQTVVGHTSGSTSSGTHVSCWSLTMYYKVLTDCVQTSSMSFMRWRWMTVDRHSCQYCTTFQMKRSSEPKLICSKMMGRNGQR